MEYPEMIKEVKKYGDSFIIRLNPDDVKLYALRTGCKIKLKILEVEYGRESEGA